MPSGVKVKDVSLIGSNQSVEWAMAPEGLKITTPVLSGDKAVCFKIECE